MFVVAIGLHTVLAERELLLLQPLFWVGPRNRVGVRARDMERKPRRKGEDYEWRLTRELQKHGLFTLRIADFSSRKLGYPDLIVVKNGKAMFIEAKYRADDRHILIPIERYEKMKRVEEITGARIILCVLYRSIGDWRCIDIDNYTWRTNRHIVYTRNHITEKGVSPNKLTELL